MKSIIIGASALAAVFAISTPARAQLECQLGVLDLSANGGLNPATGEAWQQGDKYHLIYVTTGTTAATSTDIATYNAFVQADAQSEGMGGVKWFVMGSTSTTNAINNAVVTGPVMNVHNSATVATDATDLWDLNFTSTYTPKTRAGENKNLFTGTQGGGTAANPLGGTGVRLAWSGWTNWQTAWRNEPAANFLNLAAISEELKISGPQTPFQLTITANAETPGSYDLEWDSRAGKLYNLRTSTDLAGAIPTWQLVEGDIEATPPTNLRTVAPTDEKRFYALEEFDAPPLLSVDFEENDGGFTVATVEGSNWERGTPDSSGIGGTINAGNNGSAIAWATNPGTFSTAGVSPTATQRGFYAAPTNTALRSPVIDLTDIAGAVLNFAEAVDFPTTDTAVVNLIHATSGDIIAQIHQSLDEDTSSANWRAVGPISLAAGFGQEVWIEWRFQGSGGALADFMGWYVDDVVVTIPN